MNTIKHIVITLFTAALLSLPSCSSAILKNVDVTVPPPWDITPQEIQQALETDSRLSRQSSEGYLCEIVVYRFIEGIESWTLQINNSGDQEDNLKKVFKPGRIKVLVKLHKNNKLKKVFFIEATGLGKEDILANLKNEFYAEMGWK
jgi:hypothetical protein